MKYKVINKLLFVIVFLGALLLGKFAFCAVMSLYSIIALKELISLRKKNRNYKIEIELLYYIILLFFVMNNYGNNIDNYFIDYKLLSVLIFTGLIPVVIINNKKKYSLLDAFYLIGSTLFVGITFNLLVQFREADINYVIYLVIISIVSIIFEYITTKYIGKTKFLPTITPKKTIEGILGGVAISTIIATMYFISTITTNLPIYAIVIITCLLSWLGKIGELVFSFIKKEFNKSNFSSNNALKSGILDVIDNILFIVLGFVLFVSII